MNENEKELELDAEQIEDWRGVGNHFDGKETISPIHFRHIDWAQERPKMIDALKMLEADHGRGFIIWRDNKPYIFAGSYIARAALLLDKVAKEAEAAGMNLTANLIDLIERDCKAYFNEVASKALDEIASRTEEEQRKIDEERGRLELEIMFNPYSAEETFTDAIDYGKRAHELTEADFSLMVDELSRRHPRIKNHLDRRREALTLSD